MASLTAPRRRGPACLRQARRRQRGAAILAAVALLVLVVGGGVIAYLNEAGRQNKRQQDTALAMAKAREALIGYAAGVDLTVGASRPGDLPCPDTDNDGIAEGNCGNATGTTGQANRLGRLPWRTLGLEDLRDGEGERLWYAVSNSFKNNTRTVCSAPGNAGCLNSDARGTITVRQGDGTVILDGSNPDPFVPSGAVAVIISPGGVIQRQGAGASQDRSAAGVNTATNYLDVGNGEDNAAFADGTGNGFINGPVVDANGAVLVNDRVLPVTYDDLMPLLERRVAGEVAQCLSGYAAQPQNNGRYPWAASMNATASTSASSTPYSDTNGTRFGRIPDTFNATLLGTNLGLGGLQELLATVTCGTFPLLCMQTNWPAECAIPSGTWWMNWKESVLYGVADAYKPTFSLLGVSLLPPPACGSCLTVNPPAAGADKQFVVIVAGRRLAGVAGGQPRASVANKSNPANYAEGENDWAATASDTFTEQPLGTIIHDRLRYQ
jgi:hypothetical protein